jgi:hypothetical protein
MTTTIEVHFTSIPADGDTAYFTYVLSSTSVQIPVLFKNTGYTPVPGEIVVTIPGSSSLADLANNYKTALQSSIYGSYFTITANTVANGNVIISATNPNAGMGMPVDYTGASQFLTFYSSVTVPPSGDGVSVAIKVDNVQDAATFLATDFLDMGGKSNAAAYRNPKYLNFNTNSTAAPGNNATAFVCKSSGDGGSNMIDSYTAGLEGGFTTGTNPGWEWWNRSLLVRDSNLQANVDAHNTITGLGQLENSCLWAPGTNALGNGSSIPYSCGVGTPPTLTPLDMGSGSIVLNSVTAINLVAFEYDWTTTGLDNITNITAYWRIASQSLWEPHGGDLNIDYNSDPLTWSPTTADFNTPPNTNQYPIKIRLAATDSVLGVVCSNEIQIDEQILLPQSWFRNGLQNLYSGTFTYSFKSNTSGSWTTNKVLNFNTLGALDLGEQYDFIDDSGLGEVTRTGYHKARVTGILFPNDPPPTGHWVMYADFYDSDPVNGDVFRFSLTMQDLNGTTFEQDTISQGLTTRQITGIHADLYYDYTCPDPEELIMISENGYKKAGDLTPGDTVYTQHEITKEWGFYNVSKAFIAEGMKTTLTFDDETDVTVSVSHKFMMSDGEWKTCAELIVGDSLQGYEKIKTIKNITRIGRGPVVNIEIEDAHTYVVAGLISHNKNINN